MINAVILAAGYGTRLYPRTIDTPKCLLNLGEKTALDLLVDNIRGIDPEEIYLITNQRFYGQFCGRGLYVVSNGTKTPEEKLGSVGDLKFARSLDGDVLVTASDKIYNFEMIEFHKHFRKIGKSIALVSTCDVAPTIRKRGVVCVEDGRITRFEEKPKKPFSNKYCAALYLFTEDDLTLLDEYEGDLDSLGEFAKFVAERSELHAFEVDSDCVGDVEDYI